MAGQHGLRLRLGNRSLLIYRREGILLRFLGNGMAVETDWTRGRSLASLATKGLARRCLDLEAARGRPVYVPTSFSMQAAEIYQKRLRRVRWVRRQRLASKAAILVKSVQARSAF
jgi:hypothetical protein